MPISSGLSRLRTALTVPNLDSPNRCYSRFSPLVRLSCVLNDRVLHFIRVVLFTTIVLFTTVVLFTILLDENFDVLAIFLIDHIDDLALCAALDIFDKLGQVDACQLGSVLGADLQPGIHQA